ncbi:MAG TPA: AarF/ABC1/UbiB kinase family protein [Polyangiales bacterium]|nr:AarF/ABC1/UbiB kinase family protein [Polyangiales bacterium]
MTDEQDLPTGRWARLSRVARVGARSGLAMLGNGTGSAAAEQALELLGNLRGLAAKVGQMASYVDGMVPEEQREAYERVLSGLQRATASSPFPKVRELIERELGASLAELFAEFDAEPMASASIGQVHRARLHSGDEVAVKVQHPGIEAAIETDLSSAGLLVGLVSRVAPSGMNTRELHEEIAQHFREELDYRLEAERQTTFAGFHAGDAQIHVPRVFASHCSRRVLTSELVRGSDFASALQQPAAERREYARVLWRFVFKAILVEGLFNADPHPGNYLFHPGGRVTFLDFGCVQRLDPGMLVAARTMHAAAISGDVATFKRAAAEGCRTRPGPYETDLLDYLWRCYAPLRSESFHLTREYVAEVVRSTQDMKRHLLSRRSNVTPVPRGIVLTNRLQFGFYSVLARFDVTVDYAQIDREILALLG